MYDSYSEYYDMHDVYASGAQYSDTTSMGGAGCLDDSYIPPYKEAEHLMDARRQDRQGVHPLTDSSTRFMATLLFAFVSGIAIFFGFGLITCGPNYDAVLTSAMIFIVASPAQGVIWFISIAVFSSWLHKRYGEHDPDELKKNVRNAGVIGAGMALHHAHHLKGMGKTLMSNRNKI